MKDYIVETQGLVAQRDVLRLSLQTNCKFEAARIRWRKDMREKKRNHYKNKGRIVKGILSFALALAMVSGTLPGMPFVMTARAESAASEKTITGLGTGAITNPVQPTDTASV